MTILQQYGIFSGGVLTKQPLLGNSILLSPYVLNLFEGSVTGSGDINHTNVTKAIQLSFGVNASPSILRDVLNPPQYKIFVGQLASQIYITYDEGHADIGLSTVFPVNTIIFGVIKWATNNGAIITDTTSPYFNQPLSINTIDIDLSFRTEALVVKTTGGLEATKLYYDSQRYIAGNLNKPLVDSAVVSEVLLAESSLRSGGSFFITLLQDSQIHTDTTLTVGAINLSVILEPCEHIARVGNEFQKFKTKAKTGSSHALVKTYTNITEVVGKYIYILLDKNTGVVSVTENTSVNTVFSNYYVIARSETAVVLTDTDLNNVVFQVLNDIISLTRVQQDTAILQKALNPNGWMNTVTFNETPIANTIHLTEATACINGFGVEIPSQNITLPSPPSTSIAFDIIWLEVEFVADPILRILPTIHVTRTTDNNIINFTDPILHPSIVNSAATPLNFTKEPNNTYQAIKPENTYNSKTFALPLALISRFNTNIFSATNGNGGVNRPDNKTPININLEECIVNAPTINKLSPKQLLGKNSQKLLKGYFPVKLEQAVYGSGATEHYSTKPLQVDYLGSNTIGTNIGIANGGRRLWSHNIRKEDVMSFKCESNVDFSGIVGVFNSTANHKLTIKIPAGAVDTELVLDQITGQPAGVSVVWAVDGSPVKLVGNWAVGPLNEVADILLDTTAPSFSTNNPGQILVSFSLKYTQRKGLSHLPEQIISATINDSPIFANKYWLNSAKAANGLKNSQIGSPTVIGSTNYYKEFWEISLGTVGRFFATQIRIPVVGNNLTNTSYIIPDSIVDNGNTYIFNGLSSVLDKTGIPIAIAECKWVSVANQFEIKLVNPIPNTEIIWFCMGVIGKAMEYDKGNSEITNLTEAHFINPILAPSTGILKYSSGNLIYGFASLNNRNIVYVEDYAVPVSLIGINSNFVIIDLNISTLDYNILPIACQANYIPNGQNGWKPVTNAVIKFGTLESRNETNSLVIKYKYNSSPYNAFDPTYPAVVVDRGFLIQTTDGSGSSTNNPFGPLDLILPAVQGVLVTGDSVSSPSPLGMNDIFQYQQTNNPFLEGSEIIFDSSLALNVNTHQNEGLSAWLCLIEQNERLLLFIYEVRDGIFVLNNINQAFVIELNDFRRVK